MRKLRFNCKIHYQRASVPKEHNDAFNAFKTTIVLIPKNYTIGSTIGPSNVPFSDAITHSVIGDRNRDSNAPNARLLPLRSVDAIKIADPLTFPLFSIMFWV